MRSSHDLKADAVARALAEDIVAKRLGAGVLLPAEARLSERLGVSRSVVREGIRSLAATGLVATRHGVGSLVNDSSLWNIFDPLVLEAHVATGCLPSLVGELVELRRLVEVSAAGLAAERVSDIERQELHQWHQRMQQLIDDPQAMAQADIRFHDVIVAAAKNRFLHAAMEYVRPVLTRARVRTAELGGRSGRRSAQRAHTAILSCIDNCDAEGARTAMREHVRLAEDDIRAAMLAIEPPAGVAMGG